MTGPANGSATAVIPARGGSKGIAGKNLRTVGGVPLVVRAVRACAAARRIGTTVVSTDHPGIAAAARSEGATVVGRPAVLAGDDASSESAVRDAVLQLVADGHPLPDVTVLVQCTSPFVAPDDIDRLVETVAEGRADSCFTVAPSHRFLWRTDATGAATPVNHGPGARRRRQDLAPEYVETGAAYAFTTTVFLAADDRFCGRSTMVECDATRALEIDDPADLVVADALAAVLDRPSAGGGRGLPSPLRAVVFDFDGVMTDNRVVVLSGGEEAVIADRRDGLGIGRLREHTALHMLVLSTETDPVVRRRCAKLGLPVQAGAADKAAVLKEWLSHRDVDPAECAYIGNDLNDHTCMQLVGCALAPYDAEPATRRLADIVLGARGGRGAVRELAEMVLAHPGTVRRPAQ